MEHVATLWTGSAIGDDHVCQRDGDGDISRTGDYQPPRPLMFTVRTVLVSKKMNVPLIAVLQALDDPMLLLRTGPTIVSLTVDPDDPDMYEIAHKVTYVGCIKRPRRFKARFIRLRDGVTSEVFAQYGTRVSSHWRARSLEGGKSSQVEVENSISVQFFLSFFFFLVTE